METQDITVPTLIAVSALPGAMFWRHNCGVFLTLDGRRHVNVGPEGAGDIMGTLRARAVAIETKTRRGRLRETQKRFRAAWEAAGNIYVIARSPEEALDALAGVRPPPTDLFAASLP